ncbi:RsmG family class I SAM-dependent methyltransferase [Thermodesulfatator indicus]
MKRPPDISWEEGFDWLKEKLKASHISYDLKIFGPKLKAYLAAFEKEAQALNLTAAKSRFDLLAGPVYEALFLAKYLPRNMTCADLGTGAGFPGLIVKIARPDLRIFLVEGYPPRVSFMKKIVKELALEDVYPYLCHVGFQNCPLKVSLVLARGYGSPRKFLKHGREIFGASQGLYLWRKDVEKSSLEKLPIKPVYCLPISSSPVELLVFHF